MEKSGSVRSTRAPRVSGVLRSTRFVRLSRQLDAVGHTDRETADLASLEPTPIVVKSDAPPALSPKDVQAASIADLIKPHVPMLVNSLVELAMGVLAEEPSAEGVTTYKIPPNRMAAEYLINRVIGRPIPAEADSAHADDHYEQIALAMLDLRNLTTNELMQLHQKTITADRRNWREPEEDSS